MEAHLRKITRCLGRAVGELEVASASEKTAGEASPCKNSSSHEAGVCAVFTWYCLLCEGRSNDRAQPTLCLMAFLVL